MTSTTSPAAGRPRCWSSGRRWQRVAGADHLTPEFHPARKVNPVPRRLADVRRARDELGFVAEVPLEEGLRRLADWRREDDRQPEVLAS